MVRKVWVVKADWVNEDTWLEEPETIVGIYATKEGAVRKAERELKKFYKEFKRYDVDPTLSEAIKHIRRKNYANVFAHGSGEGINIKIQQKTLTDTVKRKKKRSRRR